MLTHTRSDAPHLGFILIGVNLLTAGISSTAAEVDYHRHIRPLLVAKCVRCHGPREQAADLRLDIRPPAPVIVPGDSNASELLRRITLTDPDERMPPEGAPLTVQEVTQLRRWIEQGAKGLPDSPSKDTVHWAFRSIGRPDIPAVADEAWPRNPIDNFVLALLERKNIAPSPQASRETLIRRLSLDLLGLPPTWSEVVHFVKDDRPDAYKRLVDRLLASPHYGERWARHWLDLARYADSSGYEADRPREIWRYRDWVIRAFNDDMPFDQFVIEQLAGDLLPAATTEQRIATGFHCNAMFDPGVRWEAVLDRVNTTGSVFLGLTLSCAQCHDHKTDPLSQREYYQLYAFFNEAVAHPLDLGTPQQVAQRDAQQAEIDDLQKQLDAFNSSADDSRRVELEKLISDLKEKLPQPPTSLVMKAAPQETHMFVRGDHAQPGQQVNPATPAFLPPLPETTKPDRLDLAHWIVDPQNPLTARVTVNRFWQRFFGRGLVATATDFGQQTPPPTHLALLDWLASKLVDSGWSTKQMHRLIVTSATYRQSAAHRSDLSVLDPQNVLLARQQRLRLEAEIIRDVALAASGLLEHRIGGPSVFPYQPRGILDNRATPATWTESEGPDRYRRGLYTWVWRLTPHPLLPLFDAPDLVTACARRDHSNVPVQALTLLNDPAFVEAARALADRVLREESPSDEERLRSLFRHCLSREPSSSELEVLQDLLADQLESFESQVEQAMLVADSGLHEEFDAHRHAAWTVVSRVVLNLDEAITRE